MSDNQSKVTVQEFNSEANKSFIHYQPERVDFTVAEPELKQLEHIGNSISKDIALTTLGIGVPCLINAMVTYSKDGKLSGEVMINCVIGFSALFGSLLCGYFWRRESKVAVQIFTSIRNRPQFELPKATKPND